MTALTDLRRVCKLNEEQGGGIGAERKPEADYRTEVREASVLKQETSNSLTIRAAMNSLTEFAAYWRATPPSMIVEPRKRATLRPRRSLANGVKGSA